MPDPNQDPPVRRDQVRREADAVERRVPAEDLEKAERKRQTRALVALAAAGAMTPPLVASELAAAVYRGQLL